MEIINDIGKYEQPNREWYDRTYPIKKITVHHTASRYTGSDDSILKSLMADHVKNGWVGLAYHYIILKNGNIHQINSLDKVTWHDTVNWDSIGVCLHGYFHPDIDETPTNEQLRSLDWLLDFLCTENPQFPADHDDVVGHRERSSTACPGNLFFPKVVEYRTSLGDVDWGNIESWKDYFLLDVTKRLPEDVFIGLKLDRAKDFPRETALDSIKDEWNKMIDSRDDNQQEALENAIEKAREFEDKHKLEVEAHKKTKKAFDEGLKTANDRIKEYSEVIVPELEDERDDALDSLEIANTKIERLLAQEFTLPEVIQFLINSLRKGGVDSE